ncbi:MAG TPA: amidohydrolase family protein [Roseiarcus sp.]|nr:amidohydrolase family protein [Roseiarcus sp.]
MRTIALEEHFATPAFMDGPGRKLKERAETTGGRLASLVAELIDVGDGRVAAMDAAGVDVQALSLTAPGVEQLETEEAKAVARETNVALAKAIERHPTRFFGLASLPIGDPPSAVVEMERAAGDHGFKGLVVNGHHRGRYLDDRFFRPVLARAEALKLPIYLHPTQSPEPVTDAWYGGLAPMVSEMMAGAGWGWHIETALHVLRMVLGGAFDAHPGLQIVVGHMGETLPFMIERVDAMPPSMTGLEKPVSAYLRENVHYTFSGFNFLPTFLDLMLEVGVDRIMFSTDHPYQAMAEGRAFLDRLPVSPADRKRIAHGNAERLFRV